VTTVEREGLTPSLHQLVSTALERGTRAQADSRALIDDHDRLERALRETLTAIRRRRGAAPPPARSETDSWRV
jgi:hypothetical protein